MALSDKSDSDGDPLVDLREAAYASARRFVRHHQAEDAAQEAMIAFVVRPYQLDRPEGWVRKVAGNKAKTEYGREKRHAAATDPAELTTTIACDDVEYEAEKNRVIANLVEFANNELKGPQQASLLALIEAGGNNGDAIALVAEATGRSVEAMRTHLRRAKKKAVDHYREDPGAVA